MLQNRPARRNASYENNVPFARQLVERSPFPARVFVKQNFCLSLTFATSTVAFQLGTENVFRLNSCFDPDLTGGTHRPYGFNEIAGLYKRYRVHAVTADVIVSPHIENATTGPVIWAAMFQPSSATDVLTGQTASDVEEKTQGTVMWLDACGIAKHFRQRVSIANVEGATEEQIRTNVEEYAALVSSDPIRTPYLRMAVAAANGVTSGFNVPVRIRLEYEVEFFDRAILAASN